MSGNSSEQQEIEMKDFIFKQMRKLRVFKSPVDLTPSRTSLVAVSNHYGLIYVAGDNATLKAIKVETLEKVFIEIQGSLQMEEENYHSSSIDVGYPFSHIALSCDDLTMAISFKRNDSCMLGFLDVRAFFSSKEPKKMFCEVVLAGETDVKVRDIAWNPTACGIIAVLLTNSELLMVELKGTETTVIGRKKESITAVSWSPKGKQIVAGCRNGSLMQLAPNLEKKRDIPPPSILTESCEVSDLVWISTYHFGAVFSVCDDSGDPSLIMITAPKNGPVSFANFGDVYYGTGEDREACFYLKYIAEWKMLLSIFAASYEVVTVGGGEGSWMKWNMPDSARAVMPTTHDQDDTYPLGLGVSFNAMQPIKQDDQTHPPAPIMILLSTDGVLCPFYMLNKNPTAPKDFVKPAKQLEEEERLPRASSIKPGVTENTQRPTGTAFSSPNITTSSFPPGSISITLPPGTIPITLHSSSSLPKGTVVSSLGHREVKPSINPSSIPTSSAPSSKLILKPGDVKEAEPPLHKQKVRPSKITPNPSSETQASATLSFLSSEGAASPGLIGSETGRQLTTTRQTESTPRQFGTDNTGSFHATLSRETVRFSADKSNSFEKRIVYPPATGVKPTNGLSKVQQKEKMPTNLSPSKQEQFEASFQKHIHNEVETFNKHMDQLRKRVNDMKKIENTLKEITREMITKQVTIDMRFFGDVNNKVKELNDDVQDVKSGVLEAFELLEDAKIRDGAGRDASYLHLLKGRGLDLGSQRKMKDIQSSYLSLDNTLREVNMALDEKWEKENKQTRALKTPSLEFIYQTMRQNQKITRNQYAQLEAISNHVKNRSVHRRQWDGRGVGLLGDSEDVVSLSERLRSQKLHSVMSTTATVPARKQSELRNMLSKRSSIPVRKTTFISDCGSRNFSLSGSSTNNDEIGAFSSGNIENEEKNGFIEEKTERKNNFERGKLFNLPKGYPVVDKANITAPKKQKETNAGSKPPLSTKDTFVKKPSPQEFSPKEIPPSPSLRPAQPTTSTPVASFLKDTIAGVASKPTFGRSPRDAAAAAALARAGGNGGLLGPGAAIPAKAMVEHKALDSTIMAPTSKDFYAQHHARLIAEAALKDAENKMKNVTQTPPSNTGTTFTVRSSTSSSSSSAGPPVMVLTPGGTFAVKKSSVGLVPSSTIPSSVVTQPTIMENQKQPFLSSQRSIGDKSQAAGSSSDKPLTSLSKSPLRAQGTGVGAPDDSVHKTSTLSIATASSPLNPADISDEGKENVARNLFGKEQTSVVAVRGEPEGESKQTVAVNVVTTRQAAVGKSGKDTPPPSSALLGNVNQSPQNTTSPADSTNLFSKPLSNAFYKKPFVFVPTDPQTTFPNFGNIGVAPPASFSFTPAPLAATGITPSPPLDTGITSAPPAATGITPSPPLDTGITSAPPAATGITPTPPLDTGIAVTSSEGDGPTASTTETTTSVAPTSSSTAASSQPTLRLQAHGSPGAATQSPLNGSQTETTSLSSQVPTVSPHSFTNTTRNVPVQQTSTPSATMSVISSVSTVTTSPLNQLSFSVKKGSTETQLSNFSQTVTSTSATGFLNSFSANSLETSFAKSMASTTSAPLLFATTTNATQLTSFQTSPATVTTKTAPVFPASLYPASSQNTGSGLAGGFSGLGGKPIEPNRNPFEASPLSQKNDSNLFGTGGGMEATSSTFQSTTSKPFFGSSSPGSVGFPSGAAATQGSGIASMGFGGPSMTAAAPLFGASPVFGGQPSFGNTSTFGGSPSFGSAPMFGGAATFGSGVGSPTFGGNAVFGSAGNSPERVFGSGTGTSAMFSSSTNPTFGSLSAQSGVPSFDGLAGGRTDTGLGGSTGFNPQMSGSSFASYR